jgi:hypothetical protein
MDYLTDLPTWVQSAPVVAGAFAVASDAVRRWYVSVKTTQPKKE